ncbi:MAG: hypothetical protein HC913_05575 [Microscillaceae bacterium]|nr:hypothetical protein [Microscillaceae bacterium]
MDFIPFEQIEDLSASLNQLSDAEIESLLNQFMEEQPHLVAYLTAIGEDDFTDEEHETLLTLGMELWYILKSIVPPLPLLSEEAIDQADQDNEENLGFLRDADRQNQAEAIEQLAEEYPQGDILVFIFAVLDSEDEDGIPLLEDESVLGDMFLALKTVLDGLLAQLT